MLFLKLLILILWTATCSKFFTPAPSLQIYFLADVQDSISINCECKMSHKMVCKQGIEEMFKKTQPNKAVIWGDFLYTQVFENILFLAQTLSWVA